MAKSIISDGLSAGGAEIKVPRAEKQKAAIIVPKIKLIVTILIPSKKTHTETIKKAIQSPNKTEAKISPKIIAQSEIGEDTNLSKVLIFVSQGAITGVIAETVKKRAIPINPGIKKLNAISLLTEKERNKKAGINKP